MIKAVHGLAAGFVRNSARVTVLCDGQQDSVVHSPAGYEIRCYKYSGRLAGQNSDGLQRYIAECDDPGVFLLNGAFNTSVFFVSRLCRRYGIPYIVAPHDPYHPTIFVTNWHLKWPYWYLREKPMLQQARAVQVLDLRHAEWLRAWGIHTPVVEVLNGYAPQDVLPETQLGWRLAGPVRFLYLGRFDSHNKGLDILLDAFARLHEQSRIDARLTLQGPDWGDRDAIIRRAARLGLGDRVQFKQPEYDKPAAQIAAEHDVFLLPSRFEGFGLSALEAMLAARVLLVSDVAGIAPHVRASGCGVVVAADVEQVQSGLMQLLEMRSQWQEMGMAGRRYALVNLQWDQIAQRALVNYRAILKTRPDRLPVPAPAPA